MDCCTEKDVLHQYRGNLDPLREWGTRGAYFECWGTNKGTVKIRKSVNPCKENTYDTMRCGLIT